MNDYLPGSKVLPRATAGVHQRSSQGDLKKNSSSSDTGDDDVQSMSKSLRGYFLHLVFLSTGACGCTCGEVYSGKETFSTISTDLRQASLILQNQGDHGEVSRYHDAIASQCQ